MKVIIDISPPSSYTDCGGTPYCPCNCDGVCSDDRSVESDYSNRTNNTRAEFSNNVCNNLPYNQTILQNVDKVNTSVIEIGSLTTTHYNLAGPSLYD